MIEIDGLTKRYGDKTAVDGLSFVVEPGVVTGFLGPNGAGKSTTMRLIAGLDQLDTGRSPGNAPRRVPRASTLAAPGCHPGLSRPSHYWTSVTGDTALMPAMWPPAPRPRAPR